MVGDSRKRYQAHVAQPSTGFGGRPSLDLHSSVLSPGLAALHMGRLADSPIWCPLLSLFSSELYHNNLNILTSICLNCVLNSSVGCKL